MKRQAFQPLCSTVFNHVSTGPTPLPPSIKSGKKSETLRQSLQEMRSQNSNGRKKRTVFKIPTLNKKQKKKWDDGIKAAKARLAVNSSEHANESILGRRYLQPATTRTYTKHIDGMKYFCFLLGDFDSMLILLKNAPPGRLVSVDLNSVKLFIKWKVYTKGTALLDDNGNAVMDLEGNPIVCAGSWNAPDNIRQFGSALTLCHSSRGNGGVYTEACKDFQRGKESTQEGQSFFWL
jgi:hypothetical protein